MTTARQRYEQAEFGGGLSPCFEHVRATLASKRVLDIACGDGTYLQQFAPGSIGLDMSDPNLQRCRHDSLLTVKADLNTIFPVRSEAFDVVFCSNILEHVDSPLFMLRESHRVLRDNGVLVLCVPNEDSLIHWFYDYFEPNGRHLYSFSVNNLHALLRESKFEAIQVFGDFHSVLSRRLRLTRLLELLHCFPLKAVNKLAIFYWIVAQKK